MANDPSFVGEIEGFGDVLDAFYAAVLLEKCNEDISSIKTLSQTMPYKEAIGADDVEDYEFIYAAYIAAVMFNVLKYVFLFLFANMII